MQFELHGLNKDVGAGWHLGLVHVKRKGSRKYQSIVCVGDSAPTQSWGDSRQNCLHDMRIVGNAQLVWDG
jgi:hypothetical protein